MRKIFLVHVLLSVGISYVLINLVSYNLQGLELLSLVAGLFLLVWMLSFLYHRRYFYTFKAAILLAFYFLKELIISNFKIIYFILSPGRKFRPAILELPLSLKSDFSITLLANLITLTPGTITLEVSDDKKYLYFHVIDVPDENLENAKQRIKNGFEKRIMEIKA